jgi:hypothetical protein
LERFENTGFHDTGDLKTSMSGDGLLAKRTTKLGQEFSKIHFA